MSRLYDQIGHTYSRTRVPDPRIASRIREALGRDVETVVNVGAGTGGYEPADLRVTAVEPSAVMIAQRAASAAPVVEAAAERLPFADRSFDAAMAVWTVHHWSDPAAGLRELRRVARRRVVVATWDPATRRDFWLAEYLPDIWQRDTARFPALELYRQCLGPLSVEPLPVPANCTDGFSGAFWARPERYLDRDAGHLDPGRGRPRGPRARDGAPAGRHRLRRVGPPPPRPAEPQRAGSRVCRSACRVPKIYKNGTFG